MWPGCDLHWKLCDLQGGNHVKLKKKKRSSVSFELENSSAGNDSTTVAGRMCSAEWLVGRLLSLLCDAEALAPGVPEAPEYWLHTVNELVWHWLSNSIKKLAINKVRKKNPESGDCDCSCTIFKTTTWLHWTGPRIRVQYSLDFFDATATRCNFLSGTRWFHRKPMA